MGELTVYLYPKCSTCRNAVKWLEARGHRIRGINVVEQPPGERELKELIRQSGLEVKKFFNTSGELYRTMNLKERLPLMSEEEMVQLLSSNGKLIKRPIVTDGRRTTVGFHPSDLVEVW